MLYVRLQLELEGLKRQLAAAHEAAQSQADALTNRLHAAEATHRDEIDGAMSQLRVERAARNAELERLRNSVRSCRTMRTAASVCEMLLMPCPFATTAEEQHPCSCMVQTPGQQALALVLH